MSETVGYFAAIVRRACDLLVAWAYRFVAESSLYMEWDRTRFFSLGCWISSWSGQHICL